MKPWLKRLLRLMYVLIGAAGVAVGLGITVAEIWHNRRLGTGVGITVGGAFVYFLAAF